MILNAAYSKIKLEVENFVYVTRVYIINVASSLQHMTFVACFLTTFCVVLHPFLCLFFKMLKNDLCCVVLLNFKLLQKTSIPTKNLGINTSATLFCSFPHKSENLCHNLISPMTGVLCNFSISCCHMLVVIVATKSLLEWFQNMIRLQWPSSELLLQGCGQF